VIFKTIFETYTKCKYTHLYTKYKESGFWAVDGLFSLYDCILNKSKLLLQTTYKKQKKENSKRKLKKNRIKKNDLALKN